MKDLHPVKEILGMEIKRDRKSRKLWLSQKKHLEQILEKFKMKDAKPVCTPLASHFKLGSKQCPSNEKEKSEMQGVPYASVIENLMYVMVCTKPDIT